MKEGKIFKLFFSLLLVAAAASCLYFIVKLTPEQKNEPFKEGITGDTGALAVSEEAESLGNVVADDLLSKVPLWSDLKNAKLIRNLDYVNEAVWEVLNELSTEDYKPLYTGREAKNSVFLDGHMYAAEEKHRIYRYKGEYRAKDNKPQRLDMIFAYSQSNPRELSMLYYHCVPEEAGDVIEDTLVEAEKLQDGMFGMMSGIRGGVTLFWPDFSIEKKNYNEEDYNSLWKQYRYVLYEKNQNIMEDEVAMALNLRLIKYLVGLHEIKSLLRKESIDAGGTHVVEDFYEKTAEVLQSEDYTIFLYNRAGYPELELSFYNREITDADNTSLVLSFNCSTGSFNGICFIPLDS